MAWRYQPVWRDGTDGRIFSVCTIFVDDDDRLTKWCCEPEDWAGGESIQEMLTDLMRMYVDCARWEPVAFDSLHVGMTFDLLISRAEAESLAEEFEKIPVRERVVGSA